MFGSDRKALPDVQELSGGPPGWSEGSPGCPGVVKRPSRMYGSGQEALPDVLEWSGGFPGCPGVVKRPSRMSGSGRESLPNVR